MKKSYLQAMLWLLSLNALLFIPGCGGGGGKANTPAILTSITITPATPDIVRGGTQQFIATGTYSDNSTADVTLDATWTSTNTSSATITNAGLATGTNLGTSTIKASLGEKTNSTRLTVRATAVAPAITTQPASRSVTEGQIATFNVSASGTAPLTYQWMKNGANVGTNSSSYTTPVTTLADNGATFSVVVSNVIGSVTSNDATLTVTTVPMAPTITIQPASRSVTEGQIATFNVSASGTAPLTYQWMKNGANVGTNSSSYTTPVTTLADNGATFSVVVSNSTGNVTSNEAILTVTTSSSLYVADYRVATEAVLRGIPDSYIDAARTTLHVAYFHTSHGTHVSYGVFGLPDFKTGDDTKFGITNNIVVADTSKLDFHDFVATGSPYPDLSTADANWPLWRDQVRAYLDNPANAAINVMMWSWCNIKDHSVPDYLSSMQTLIDEYGPGGSKIGTGGGYTRTTPVTFIFMTGHANDGGAIMNIGAGNPRDQAALITDYCNTHGYLCIDYYSIDTHTMDGIYYEDTGDDGNSVSYGGNFYQDWQNNHIEGTDWYVNRFSPGGTATYGEHNTQHITANRKAFAFWWVLARIVGY